jgi:hypothetical protein
MRVSSRDALDAEPCSGFNIQTTLCRRPLRNRVSWPPFCTLLLILIIRIQFEYCFAARAILSSSLFLFSAAPLILNLFKHFPPFFLSPLLPDRHHHYTPAHFRITLQSFPAQTHQLPRKLTNYRANSPTPAQTHQLPRKLTNSRANSPTPAQTHQLTQVERVSNLPELRVKTECTCLLNMIT